MKFDHDPTIDLPRARQINTPSGRRYQTPDGNVYPSITTLLGDQPEKKKMIAEWRARVGEAEANKISSQAARRGTALHAVMEKYVLGDEVTPQNTMPDQYARFKLVKPLIDEHLQLIYASESPMFSDILRIAGTADLICEWKGEPTVIDFKTARQIKKADMIQDYFIQATAYSIMFEEHTGILTRKFAIIMVSDEGEIEVFEGDRNDYVRPLIRIRDQYEWRRNIVLDKQSKAS